MVSIRPVELRDAQVLYQHRIDEEVMFWGSGGFQDAIWNLTQMEEAIRNQKSTSDSRMFAIEVEENGEPRVIGSITFRAFNRISHRATIGMTIGDRNYWGQGYGTAALRKFVELLFTRFNLHRIDVDTFADNKRAIRCYEKVGFVVEGVQRQAFYTMNGYRDQVIMGLLREDWEKERGGQTYYL